jgi:hypothetical protein
MSEHIRELSEYMRELSAQELDSVTGGWAMTWVALNPQPIPPGYTSYTYYSYTPGCPGPVILPPSPC